MKKWIRNATFVALLAGAAAPYADGLSYPGIVLVIPNMGGTDMMTGQMSVRYFDTVQGDPYMTAGSRGSANSLITFSGRGMDDQQFACWVSPNSNLYEYARQVQFNLRNGSYLTVYKPTGGNECSDIYFGNSSYFLD